MHTGMGVRRRARRPSRASCERIEVTLDTLPGVGAPRKRKLAKLGLETVRDLLEHRPRRYESAADVKHIAELGGDDEVVVEGEILTVMERRRRRLRIVTARV